MHPNPCPFPQFWSKFLTGFYVLRKCFIYGDVLDILKIEWKPGNFAGIKDSKNCFSTKSNGLQILEKKQKHSITIPIDLPLPYCIYEKHFRLHYRAEKLCVLSKGYGGKAKLFVKFVGLEGGGHYVFFKYFVYKMCIKQSLQTFLCN